METFRASSDTIACTLTQEDLKETVSAWKKLLRLSLVSREEIPGGLRLVVHPGSANALRQLIDVERECCSWITFQLDGPSVMMTAVGDGESTIREIWHVKASPAGQPSLASEVCQGNSCLAGWQRDRGAQLHRAVTQ